MTVVGVQRPALDDGYPTREILFSNRPPDLIENRIDSPYQSVAEYLNIQCSLLLEDFVFPLREALRKYRKNSKTRDFEGVKIYKAVTLKNVNQRLSGKRPYFTGVLDVEDKLCSDKEIGFGSLLVFTPNDFKTDFFFGVVISDDEKDHTGKPIIELKLKIPREKNFSYEELSCTRFTVIKAEAFFYVYFHVLKCLNSLSEATFPMKRYLVFGRNGTKMKVPAYLTKNTYYNVFGTSVPALDMRRWPSMKTVALDKFQYTALKRALTEEIALVQGPPGTGKTYFGIKLVKVLLDNAAVWNTQGLSPIVIVCQSNQALDHFLDGVLKITTKVVRIGDRCQSAQLKPYCLKELVCRKIVDLSHVGGKKLRDHLRRLDKIRLLRRQLSEHGIVALNVLKRYGIVGKSASAFESDDSFLWWLGFESGVLTDSADLIFSVKFSLMVVKRLKESGQNSVAQVVRKDLKEVQQLLADYRSCCRGEISTNGDVWSLQPSEAKMQYLHWVDKLNVHLQDKESKLEKGLQVYLDKLQFRDRLDVQMDVLKSAFVVGLTSTGAASRWDTLERMQSPIVIIEEAAALLESHAIVSMTCACQHLILLGDHKQLKPGLTTHHMGTDYNLNISLFERLSRSNIVKGSCLSVQYRMRPEISSLLKPHIYNQLIDADTARDRPPIKGVLKNLFFLDHEEAEEKTEHNAGIRNLHEVNMLIGLARYLVSVGYTPTDITVIAMYSEQKNTLIKARDTIPSLTNLQIASVDSFQGKENEIILLSLVRSNKEGNIGFLKEENRVCVALSRARSGLFIMGNMKCLVGSKRESIWQRVHQRLKKECAIGTHLILVCEKHSTYHQVSKADHWNDSFCRFCNYEYECKEIVSESIEKPQVTESFSSDDSSYETFSSDQDEESENGTDTEMEDLQRNCCCACTEFFTRPILWLFRLF